MHVVSTHPILTALHSACTKLQIAKDLVDECVEDDGARLKIALNDFMASMLELNRIAQHHSDGNTVIPIEIIRNGCDMEALRISELESILAQHDKIRNRNRHLNDLAQLLNAAVNTFDNFKEED